MRDYSQAKIANDQNEVVKRLTAIASILLVPTFIVGLYGQNFIRSMPELRWRFGYEWSWGLIIVTTIAADRLLPPEALAVGSPVPTMAAVPYFICPNCKQRSIDHDRREGLSQQAVSCQRCGFGFLFELLEDYYPAPGHGLRRL